MNNHSLSRQADCRLVRAAKQDKLALLAMTEAQDGKLAAH
jgi:hypothetical protein